MTGKDYVLIFEEIKFLHLLQNGTKIKDKDIYEGVFDISKSTHQTPALYPDRIIKNPLKGNVLKLHKEYLERSGLDKSIVMAIKDYGNNSPNKELVSMTEQLEFKKEQVAFYMKKNESQLEELKEQKELIEKLRKDLDV